MVFSKIKEWVISEGKVKSLSIGGKLAWKEQSETPDTEALSAPTISLDGDILTMTATDEHTEEFVIFVGGVETATVKDLITFTIDGTTYYAENGMTWGEWVDSEYGTDKYYISNNVIQVNGETASVYDKNGKAMFDSHKIEPNGIYYHGAWEGVSGGGAE
jgi:hypothetical protein